MIDYKVGDWVETCHIMPGIVQSVDAKQGIVEIFYPHYKEQDDRYTGGSCCSTEHCGVHKITEEQAHMMLSIGEERLILLWDFLKRNTQINSIEKKVVFYQKQIEKISGHIDDDNYSHWAFPWVQNGKSSYDYAFNSFNRSLKEYEEKLHEAWKEHEKLWKQTIVDLFNGVVNNITQGIWLSYPKVYIEKIENRFRIVTIRTGERFLVRKIRCSKRNQPSNKKYHKYRYKIIKKL